MSDYEVDPDLLRECIEVAIGPGKRDGPETDYTCPFCEKAGYSPPSHLHVNFRKNVALCHRCAWGCRDLKFLVLALLGKIPKSISRVTSDQDVEDVVHAILFANDHDVPVERTTPITLPTEFIPLTGRPKDRHGQVVLAYLKSRGVPFDRLVEVGAGYCAEGAFCGYAVFPVHVRGELITFTSRRVTGLGSKQKHAWASDASLALFNYDNVVESRRVFVGEGPFDAFAFQKRLDAGDGGVATLGTKLHLRQARLLSYLPCEEIVVCYDQDASDKARKAAATIRKITGKKTSIIFPERDPDEYSLDDLDRLVESRSVCDPEMDEIRSILQE